jgi:hypothetical protein
MSQGHPKRLVRDKEHVAFLKATKNSLAVKAVNYHAYHSWS